MRQPGAAISTRGPRLLKLARLSSGPQPVGGPTPPGAPSESTMAETVMTSGQLAGVVVVASTPSSVVPLPAAAIYTTPAATELEMAAQSGLSASTSPALMLMLATSMTSAWAVTQSTPAIAQVIAPAV